MHQKIRFEIFFGLMLRCCLVEPVSFYGESYIHMPLHNAFGDLDLELQFKTSRSYGLLLLLLGNTDYMLLQLHAGTMQFKVNYGKEDTVLNLGQHRYDDLQEHQVKVTISKAIITMIVDNEMSVWRQVQGDFKEMNIMSGVYIGGIDSETNKIFDDQIQNFRGVVNDLKLNEIDLITMARKMANANNVMEISWEADTIFNAPRNSLVMFYSETSFISFSYIHPSKDRAISFLFKTDISSVLLLFSYTKHSTNYSYVALELVERQIVFTVCKGDRVTRVHSNVILDKRWHQIDTSVTTGFIELVIDGKHMSETFIDTSGAIYGDIIYIGGVNHEAHAIGIILGLDTLKGDNSLKGGMIGCIQNILINSKVYNIHDIFASRLIGATCDGNTPCQFGDCFESNHDGEMLAHSDSDLEEFQLLSVKPLKVIEGGQADITSDNIEIVYDFKKYGIRESGILIYVTALPRYGDIEVDLGGEHRNNYIFTYLDIVGKKVKYIHQGSEQIYDEISLELEIFSSSKITEGILPERILRKSRFILPVNIKPVNDPPKIILGGNGTLRIAENSKIRITSDVLFADDPDTFPYNLTYMVLNSPNQGYFERFGRNGVPAMEFTQAEINDQQIWFLHLRSGNCIVHLQVTDGLSLSGSIDLQIQTVQLQLAVVKNSGIVLPHSSYAIISSNNLTTISNVPTQELEIRYDVVRPPRYGIIERQQYANDEWQEVKTFVQRHVNSGHVRYRHTDVAEKPILDQFTFSVKAKTYTTPYHFFRIHFEQVYLVVEVNNKLTLLHQPYQALTADLLKTTSNNPQLLNNKISYTILKVSSLGDLYKVDPRNIGIVDFVQIQPIVKDKTFTQADIDNGSIYFKIKAALYEKVSDYIEMRVHASGIAVKILQFWIEYIPLKSSVTFINNGLKDVLEGGQKAIDRHSLFIETDEFRAFQFSVISPPKYGMLMLVDPKSSAVKETNINEFTNDDIKELRLVYKHDDTEHYTDLFTFTAVPDIQKTSLQQSKIPEFTGNFVIQMQMRNDNPPVRLVDKIFQIVRNDVRLITIKDLAFMDPDIDYNSNELLFTRRGIFNGDIIHPKNKSQIYEFRQRDIKNGEIMFHHEGDDRGKALIYVTDGQFYVHCLLEVQAGNPFVEITINTGINTRSNNKTVISSYNLSVETNVNVEDKDIRFIVFEEPSQGTLQINGNKVSEFDFESLKSGQLEYQHKGSLYLEDHFKFEVFAGEARAKADFSIQIMLESAQLSPRVVNNRILEVFEKVMVKNPIEPKHLLITHPVSDARSIEYLVLVMPKHGRLYLGNKELSMEGDMTFTQQDINNGHLSYEVVNMSATTDQFVFEVSNGFTALRGLEFLIDVVPHTLPFQVNNFTVEEGGHKLLSSGLFKILDKFTSRRILKFFVKDPPEHGMIELSRNNGVAISAFTSEDLELRLVQYIHDGSESISDQFSLKVMLEDQSKESDFRTVYITVEGINDAVPQIITNKGLTVWTGSLTQITSELLTTHDQDSNTDDLIYHSTSPTNGYLSLLNNTLKPVTSFKQSWIDKGLLVFVHKGSNSGEFSFQVSDGDNTSPLAVFKIEAKPLVLKVRTNELLNAYPYTIQPITLSHIFVATNDPTQSKPIIFTVTAKPQHGSVVTVVKGKIQEVSSFNQRDINSSQIFYKHDDKFRDWTQNDSIEMMINTLYAEPLSGQILHIYVSYGNLNAENKNQLIKTAPVTVYEGGEAVIAKNNLDVMEFVHNLERIGKRVSLRFSLKNHPWHGKLTFHGGDLHKGIRFSQRDINSHTLAYKHDDSDTLFDTFNLTLHLRIEDQSLQGGRDDETTFGLVLNVTIQPVNDEPFQLETTSPTLNIVQGFSAIINKSVLNTIDKDTTPEYIVYRIIQEADNGHVAFVGNESNKIDTFTQHDIDEGRVLYNHHGELTSADFTFQVSDGTFSPYFKVFSINVMEIFVKLTRNSTVFIIQSDLSALITGQNLNLTTNGIRDEVDYAIINNPRFGKITLNGKEVDTFSQTDVDKNHVIYTQTDLRYGSDILTCSISYRRNNINKLFYSSVVVHVQVKPLIIIGPLLAPLGERVALTLLSIDASKLSEKTADNPIFTIKQGPYFGNIVRKAFAKRQIYHETYKDRSGFKAVLEFSHEDVVYMKVVYENDVRTVPADMQDNFTYILTAFNAQPAEGVFYIRLLPSEHVPVIPLTKYTESEQVTSGKDTQSEKEYPTEDHILMNEDSVKPSRVKQNHVIILAIAIPLLLIIIIALIVVYLIWKCRQKQEYAPASKKSQHLRPQISAPYQIEQPHVHIEPQELNSPESDEDKSLVEYENTGNFELTTNRAASEEADVIMPMLPHDQPMMCIPRPSDIPPTEVRSMMPSCFVTSLTEDDDSPEGAVGGSTDGNSEYISNLGDMIEWLTNHPVLLHNYSCTNPPVLRKNQYWV